MKTPKLILPLIAALTLTCCNPTPQYHADDWDLTQKRKDSLNFRINHHYTINYNFCITADSLQLQIARPYHNLQQNSTDGFATVLKHNHIAVADILIVPEDKTDSVWIKVARDQLTSGWIHEQELLKSIVPDQTLSKLIHAFHHNRTLLLTICLAIAALAQTVCRIRRVRCPFVHFSDVASAYPTLLCLTFALTCLLYAAMLKFRPEQWHEFYFHPTLSPFHLPRAASLFVCGLWAQLLFAIASAEVIFKELSRWQALCYICSLLCVCAACYMLFSHPAFFYAACPTLALYAFLALRLYFTRSRCRYVCGNCGAHLLHAGRCPHCGAWNETN